MNRDSKTVRIASNAGALALLIALLPAGASATLTTFTAGGVISASEMNDNFAAVETLITNDATALASQATTLTGLSSTVTGLSAVVAGLTATGLTATGNSVTAATNPSVPLLALTGNVGAGGQPTPLLQLTGGITQSIPELQVTGSVVQTTVPLLELQPHPSQTSGVLMTIKNASNSFFSIDTSGIQGGTNTAGNGTALNLNGGASTSTNPGGDVSIQGGLSAGNDSGAIYLKTSDSGPGGLTVRVAVDPDGLVGLGTSIPSVLGTVTAKALHDNSGALVLQNCSSTQSTQLQVWESSTHQLMSSIESNGSLFLNSESAGTIDRPEGNAGVSFTNAARTSSWSIKRESVAGTQFSSSAVGDLAITTSTSGSSLLLGPGSAPGGTPTMTLTSTHIFAHNSVLPVANNVQNLGALGQVWANVHADTVHTTSGTVTTSDGRLKTKIQESDLGLDFIRSLRPVSYYWKTSPNLGRRHGFIAQEVEATLAGRDSSIVNHDLKSDSYGINYSELISPTVKAVQELSAQVEALRTENERLRTSQNAIQAVICSLAGASPKTTASLTALCAH